MLGEMHNLMTTLRPSAVRSGLLVEVGGHTFALASEEVADVVSVERGAPVLQHNGEGYALHDLAQLLQLPNASASPGRQVVVLLSGAQRVGWIVERVLGTRPIRVKPLRGRLKQVRGVSAAALQGDAAPVLLLNPGELGAALPVEQTAI